MGLIFAARPVFAQTNQGTDFWLAETTNAFVTFGSVFAIAIANPSGATANITIAHDGAPNLLDTIPSGGLQTYTFPRRGQCSNLVRNLGKSMVYHVSSDVGVVVYIFNPLDNVLTNDASLVLPVPALGKIYRAGSYVNPLGNTRGSFVGVVAVQNGTTVQVFNAANVLVNTAVINQGEYYQYAAGSCLGINDPVSTDTTGWHIVTSVPAAAYSGSLGTSLGNDTGAADHIEEQILPEEAVAPTYVACPTLTRPVGCDPGIPGSCAPDIFRYVATVANTTVITSPAVGNAVLTNPGDFLEISTSTPHVVTADQPIYGYQYLISQNAGPPPAGIGDPAMLDMPPVDQLQFDYIFLTPSTFAFDFINVVAPIGTALTLDGNPVADPCDPVGSIGGVSYCCLRKQVSDGVHTITGTDRFGLSVSGFDNFASYAYIGGVGLQPINAGCSTGGPYQTSSCTIPVQVQLDGTPSCSDQSTPVVLWTSTDGVTFNDPTIADPLATVPTFGVSNICMTITCAGKDPVQCCSTIDVQPTCATPGPTIVPTPGSTLVPTPAPTSSALPPLNHFQCYEAHAPNRIINGVSLNDQFGPSTVQLIEPRRFCAPASKNDEDPTAVTDPDHLEGYRLRQSTPRFKRLRGYSIENQFGTTVVDIVKPEYLMIPSSKSLTSTPPPLDNPVTDHFKCYRVRGRGSVRGVNVEDQFGMLNIDLKRPRWLCAPTDKNGEGILDAETHLLCYQVRRASGAGADAPGTIYLNNQFGPDSFALFRPTELCIPSLKRPPGSTPVPTVTPTPTPAGPTATFTNLATSTPQPTLTAVLATSTPEPTLTPPEVATSTPEPTPIACSFDQNEQSCANDCPPGFECSQTGPNADDCFCVQLPPCGLDAGTCGGSCPTFVDLCLFVPDVGACACLPPSSACEAASAPTCNGFCPNVADPCVPANDDPSVCACGGVQ